MLKKRFIALAFAFHASLGSFCMMSMTYAQDMPGDRHAMSEEMAMSQMGPSSAGYCEHCDKEKEDPLPIPMNGGTPCGTGDCLMDAPSSDSIATPFASVLLSAISPPAFLVVPAVPFELPSLPGSIAPPGGPIATDTVVLLF